MFCFFFFCLLHAPFRAPYVGSHLSLHYGLSVSSLCTSNFFYKFYLHSLESNNLLLHSSACCLVHVLDSTTSMCSHTQTQTSVCSSTLLSLCNIRLNTHLLFFFVFFKINNTLISGASFCIIYESVIGYLLGSVLSLRHK